jgi:hypothetical protein
VSEESPHEHAHPHEHAAAPRPVFRFEAFADARAAQAAFEAIYPAGSPIEPVIQALVDLGAQCKTVAPSGIACRYVESERALAGWCWHVVLEAGSDKALRRASIALATLGM